MMKTQDEILCELKSIRLRLAEIREKDGDISTLQGAQQALVWALGERVRSPCELEDAIVMVAEEIDRLERCAS